MAIGDKKSLLQPSSTQAQQFRLQFTNLQPVSLTAQQPSPVTSPRTTVSAFAGVPAPVSTPSPQPAVSQTPAAVPATFRKAAFFNGATVYSASLVGGNDFKAQYSNQVSGSFSVDLIFKPAAPDSLRHTIFHTYSGSFMSQSLELYITGSELILEFTDGTTVISGVPVEHKSIFSRDLNFFAKQGLTEHMTNGFTYFAARYYQPTHFLIDFKLKAQSVPASPSVVPGTNLAFYVPSTFNTANNTHFYLGGSPAKNSYYSGSIASITFATASFFTNQQWGDMALRDLNPTTVSPQLRTYTFDNAPVEFTGSQASFSRPLELVAGTLSYVDSYLKL
jgi:hypothetical protein